MCGIAGLMTIGGQPPPARTLDALADALAHRGPDGRGRLISGALGMIQTRLAIIDLETGDQPLFAPAAAGSNERAALVANGEIYNHVELRAQMPDVAFATGSDCEVPLHLYLRHGLDYVDHLRGMYAIAIHDPMRRRLVLSRDPFGIKPLYYAETAAGFAFASEAQALVAAGLVARTINPAARDEMLQLQFTTGERTLFEGIRRVLPGETIVVEGGRVVERRRQDPLADPPTAGRSEEAGLADLDARLNDAVNIHQRSDVPYAMFLSGGIDSSTLIAMMARLNPQPVHAFCAGFPGTGAHDERERARTVAAAAGAVFHDVPVEEADFWSRLPMVAAALDDPAADYATLPTFMLAEKAREAGYKVVLTGEGGDELFAGYGRYRAYARSGLGSLFVRAMRRHGIMRRSRVLRDRGGSWRDGFAASERAAERPGRSRLKVAQATDCADWLPNDLLTKADRCMMANGVEGRVPFLDPELARFAYGLPDSLKVRDGSGKWLLRRWLAERMPAADPFSRKKGFTVPVGEWIAGHGKRLGPLVAAQPGVIEACEPGRAALLYRAPAGRLIHAKWNLLFFALWHQHHVVGRPAGGDVFETLAA